MSKAQTLAECLKTQFGDKLDSCVIALNEVTIEVKADHIIDICSTLRDEPVFAFEQLIDCCGVDYLAYGATEWDIETVSETGFSRGVNSHSQTEFIDQNQSQRLGVVYHLLSIQNNQRLRVKVKLPESAPIVPSVTQIWSSADWYEREAFDLFGILFDGHPDLRRILTDYGFIGHPFRKDFPLVGEVEVCYDEQQKRVVYQPVSIEPRVLVPRVIREVRE